MDTDKLLEKLEDLKIQATKERSHYYVKSLVNQAINKIKELEEDVESKQDYIDEIFTDTYS